MSGRSKQERLKAKLIKADQSFRWSDLVSLLKSFGFREIQGRGSRVKFDNGNPQHLINLHRPHPGNEMKRYAINQVIEKLKKADLI